MRPPAVFITGTDTGVGKTVVMAALALHLTRRGIDVGVMKPIETGVVKGLRSDAALLKQAAEVSDSLDLIRPYAFRLPLAPLDAARVERRPIRLAAVMQAYRRLLRRHTILLVEGVGGLQVPLTAKDDVLDLIAMTQAPVVVVGRAGLGGVNHARLTVNALREREIPVLALVLNHPTPVRTALVRRQAQSTVSLLKEHAGVPVIGPLPYRSGRWSRSALALPRLAGNGGMRKLTKLVLAAARANR
jgi:dethiobiotin synthetase